MRNIFTVLVAVLTGLAAGGCTGIELSALAVAAVGAGAGSVVKAGTEYTLTGAAYRTFSLSLEDLVAVVRSNLERMQLPVDEVSVDGYELVVAAAGIDRTVHLRFTPVTPAVTRLKVAVTQGRIFQGRIFLDRATASEIVTQIERSVSHLNSAADLR